MIWGCSISSISRKSIFCSQKCSPGRKKLAHLSPSFGTAIRIYHHSWITTLFTSCFSVEIFNHVLKSWEMPTTLIQNYYPRHPLIHAYVYAYIYCTLNYTLHYTTLYVTSRYITLRDTRLHYINIAPTLHCITAPTLHPYISFILP